MLLFITTFFSTTVSFAQSCPAGEIFNLGSDTTIIVSCLGETVNLTNLYSTDVLSVSWNSSNTSQAGLGYHRLIATNSDGCSDIIFINIKQQLSKWIGIADSNWHNPANWSAGTMPTNMDDAKPAFQCLRYVKIQEHARCFRPQAVMVTTHCK